MCFNVGVHWSGFSFEGMCQSFKWDSVGELGDIKLKLCLCILDSLQRLNATPGTYMD